MSFYGVSADRIKGLKERHLAMFEAKRNEHGVAVSRLYTEYSEKTNFSQKSDADIFAEFYNYFAEAFKPEIYEGELIVGTCWHWTWSRLSGEKRCPGNMGHFIADFEELLRLGISGKIRQIEKTADTEYKESMISSLQAFSKYIKAYSRAANSAAENAAETGDKENLKLVSESCEFISENPPKSFAEALQLVWFIQCFAETEANTAALSFGTVDRYLYKYYKSDIDSGVLTEDEALGLIMCFYIKASEGDESQMLTVGGECENRLSALLVKAQRLVNMRQPSIGVIISENTSDSLLEEAIALTLNGTGMPAYFNDKVIKRGLCGLGIDSAAVDNYGIVGCYEAAPQGSFSNTVAYAYNLYDSFYGFITEGGEYESFDAFFEAYKAFYADYYQSVLIPQFKARLADIRHSASPFAACILKGCAQKGLPPEKNGCDCFMFGLNILGLGLVTEALNTVRELVFERKAVSLEELCASAEGNFEDERIFSEIKSIKSFYGSNSEETNRLVFEISELIYQAVKENPIDIGVTVSPGLFWFTADIWQRNYRATLNGRRRGELLPYGIMPCATPHKQEVLSSLLSASSTVCDKFPNGCPAMITLCQTESDKTDILKSLIKTYFKSGGFHIAINMLNSDILERAKDKPREYCDLMIKISGYSTQFVKLDESMQNALIERAK